MTVPRAQLQEWANKGRDEVRRYERLLRHGDVPADRTPHLRRSLAREAELVGLALLSLDTTEARRWLQRAAGEALAGVEETRSLAGEHGPASVPSLSRALRAAVLLDDDELLSEVRAAIATLPEQYPRQHPTQATAFHRLAAVDALIAGEQARARDAIAALRSEASGNDAAAKVLTALVDGDTAAVADGLRTLCREAQTAAPSDLRERSRGDGLSRVAVFLQALAVGEGHEVPVDHDWLLGPPPWFEQ